MTPRSAHITLMNILELPRQRHHIYLDRLTSTSSSMHNNNLLSVPFMCTSNCTHSFTVAAHNICYSLPSALQMCTAVPTLFIIVSRLTISSTPYNPLNAFFLVPQIQLMLTIVCIHKLYLLTKLLTSISKNQIQHVNERTTWQSWQRTELMNTPPNTLSTNVCFDMLPNSVNTDEINQLL